jgi:hypothetical protein
VDCNSNLHRTSPTRKEVQGIFVEELTSWIPPLRRSRATSQPKLPPRKEVPNGLDRLRNNKRRKGVPNSIDSQRVSFAISARHQWCSHASLRRSHITKPARIKHPSVQPWANSFNIQIVDPDVPGRLTYRSRIRAVSRSIPF